MKSTKLFSRALLFAGLILNPLWSTSAWSQTKTIEIGSGCFYNGYYSDSVTKRISVYAGTAETEEAVESILRYTGLSKNFDIYNAEIDNAVAVIIGGRRIILFSSFLLEAARTKRITHWYTMGILAHEVGHHLSGHTLRGDGSSHQAEIEADRFAGFILNRMGASLEEAKTATRILANTESTATHPSKSRRLQAVESGWKQASSLISRAAMAPTPPDPAVDGRPYYPVFEFDYDLRGCSVYGPETVRVFSILQGYDNTDYGDLHSYLLEDEEGKRQKFYLNPNDLPNATSSWVPIVWVPGRRLEIRYAICGSGGIQDIIYARTLPAKTN